MEEIVTDKVRELAENAASNIAGWFTAGKDTSAYWMPIDVITQAIQQALDAQAAEQVALREALDIYVQASKFTGFHRAGSNPVVDHFQVNMSPDDHAKINIALTQSTPRAAQIMAVVQAVKKLAAIKKRVKESEAIIKPIPSDFWPLIHDLADMGEALEGGV
jgi:hypothetical protein